MRPHRPVVAGAFYHVATRGNRREAIYWDDDDRQSFLALVDRVVRRAAWKCHAYCLMTNHYHLLVETLEPTISTGMQELNGKYARSFNEKYGLRGHLFERRFHSELIEGDSHLLEASRYIVLNPFGRGFARRQATGVGAAMPR